MQILVLAAPMLAVAALLAVFAAVVGGLAGVAYLGVYGLAVLTGWPVGALLFGRRHPASVISGAALGYSLTAFALWVPVAAGAAWWLPILLSWGTVFAVAWSLSLVRTAPLVSLPAWGRATTRALALVLLLVLSVAALPYARIGETDTQGNRRYRAYFTADFVWHEALTAELARFDSPPRNPYFSAEPLHYYWSYFLVPATAAGLTQKALSRAPIEPFLAVGGLSTGLLLMASVFLAAWVAVPRAVPAAAATALVLLASSTEGLYAAFDLWSRGQPLAALRDVNIDAITLWYFGGLTVDGLVRSIWYNPQHSMACALGLVAVTTAARAGARMSLPAAAISGLALALALTMSPFPAGVLTMIYAGTVLWDAATKWRELPRALATQVAAAAPVGLALLWSVRNGVVDGAGGALSFGLSHAAARTPAIILGLAIGPVLLAVIAGFVITASRGFPAPSRASLVGVVVSLGMFFGVTLVLEPIWIGWRAGQIFLITAPGLVAVAIAAGTTVRARVVTTAALVLLFGAGLPTTAIDVYNAQDTTNEHMGPGFAWTVVISPAEQEALAWLDTQTPRDAVVQMALEPRGRETWSLVPSFARRRMAAGLPISLLRTPAHEAAAARSDRIFATEDADAAWTRTLAMGIDFLYVGAAERLAYADGVRKFVERPDLFSEVFSNADVAVYAPVRPRPVVRNDR